MSEFSKISDTFDTILIGRKTYDQTLTQSPEPGQEMAGFTGIKTYVFSRTMKEGPSADVKIISDNAGEFVRSLKNEGGKDIWLFGGGILAASLLRERLVDEIGVAIQPVLLGSGVPLFPDIGMQLDLQLLECKTYKNGIVALKYGVKN
jgi:dihydrofolate reductase